MRFARVVVVSGVLVAFATVTDDARADRGKIVLFGDASLKHALEVGLQPWDIDIVSGAQNPGATMPRAAEDAASIADREHASGVVWISSDASGETALWVYDAEEKRVASRPLRKTPPFDDATDAAIALSIKTLLRLTSIAPPAERFGSPPPAPTMQAPAPEASSAPPAAAPPPAEPSHPVAVEITAGARFAQTDAAIAEARATIGGFFAFGRVSLGVEASLGPGVAVDSPAFHARETDATFALHGRYKLGSKFFLLPELGPGAHIELVDGAYASGGVHTLRLDPSLDVGATAGWSLSSRSYVGLHASGSWLLRWQRFRVDGVEVLGGSPIVADVGVRLGVELP